MTRHPADAYVGIPFAEDGKSREGVHCYGLLQLYYAEQFGIQLRDYALTASDRKDVAAALQAAVAAGDWIPVEQPIDGDMVTMSHLREPCHMGLYVAGQVLHATRLGGAVFAETLQHLRRRGFGRIRFYRSAARGL